MIKIILFVGLIFLTPNTLEKQLSWLKEVVAKNKSGTGRDLFSFQETKCSITIYDISILPPEEGGNWLSKQLEFRLINGKKRAIIKQFEFDFRDVSNFEITDCINEECGLLLTLYMKENTVCLQSHDNTKSYQDYTYMGLPKNTNIKELEKRISKIISLCKKL